MRWGGGIYRVSRVGNLRFWYCNYDNERKNITRIGLSFLDYLLEKYGKYQTDSIVWDDRYVEWCNVSPAPGTSSQESNNPRPKDYTFKEWTLIKVETFKVKKYSFKGGQSFICVTKEVDDALPLERKNRLRFREIIQKEFDVDAQDESRVGMSLT
ncbi:hypothetical protein Tco_0620261 [Tanacetum coccineum]